MFITLTSSKQQLKHCKIPSVLKYCIPNKCTHSIKHYSSLLFMFLPVRNEKDLQTSSPFSYSENCSDYKLIIINRNREIANPYADFF